MKKLLTVKAIIASFVVVLFGAGSAFASIDIGGGNGVTGPNSENENKWDIDHDLKVKIKNISDIFNDLDLDVNTGKNYFKNNTSIGDIWLGDILGHISIETTDPDWDPIIDLDEFGLGDFDIDLTNDLTGPYSENENNVDIDSDVDFCMINMQEIDNYLDADLETGKNYVGHNTVVGDVYGGVISFSASIKNPSMGGSMIWGLGSPEAMDVSADLTNHLTGPNSENENTLDIDSDTSISVVNETEIKNKVDIDANTGHNDVGCNTVVGDVHTGDASISISIQN